ncbi:MAG TPA: hypothetical protein VF681_06080 [Abditibacteriaceae bacterium]
MRYSSADGPAGTTNPVANEHYRPEGYDFNLVPAADYLTRFTDKATGKAIMQLEIFDPGTQNIDPNDPYASAGKQVDEMRPGWRGADPIATTTRFTVRYDNGTPDTLSDDIVRTKVYDPANPGSDMTWNTPAEFQFDPADTQFQKPDGRFILNVATTDGTSENGFNLRAGPPHETLTDNEWITQYGNAVLMTGKGSLPLNFNQAGDVKIDLGPVPAFVKGGEIRINKFDVDVLAPGTTYNRVDYYENGSLKFSGSTTGGGDANGKWQTDSYTLAANDTGGKWTARYYAGSNDTSVCKLLFTLRQEPFAANRRREIRVRSRSYALREAE